MKKLEKLQNELLKIQNELNKASFERKDTSYRRTGGYFGTNPANTNDCIILETIKRTKYLNTYICVNYTAEELVKKYTSIKELVNIEKSRLSKIAYKKWLKESMIRAEEVVNRDIADGTINTNYGKIFIQGNKHIYYTHPFYLHEDYNKWRAMPNTPKHWAFAQMLNKRINDAKNK